MRRSLSPSREPTASTNKDIQGTSKLLAKEEILSKEDISTPSSCSSKLNNIVIKIKSLQKNTELFTPPPKGIFLPPPPEPPVLDEKLVENLPEVLQSLPVEKSEENFHGLPQIPLLNATILRSDETLGNFINSVYMVIYYIKNLKISI